ncbi:transcription antitermination factor NusB [Candidatus Dojkabacteria bacterium]|uniref:Transcription antitermination protein NusB n=1 Tax=Candidatus Dojkabacteria bacterium TaxID=2099670 RepID=A0A955RJT8_9BACT|nr:transcription antitermination factor NusB [Candidatus Dojkabacteria bacterium]
MKPKAQNKSRHFARWYALQKLFNLHFLKSENESDFLFSDTSLQEINESIAFDSGLAKNLVSGVIENKEKMNTLISKLAPERPVDQISSIDLQILYLAIFEGFIAKLSPEKVVIDEAIELTKEFATDANRRFISGVLGNLIENKETYLDYL